MYGNDAVIPAVFPFRTDIFQFSVSHVFNTVDKYIRILVTAVPYL